MFIDKKIKKYLVSRDSSIQSTLQKIDANNGRIVFLVGENEFLEGVATNGDILRWLIKTDDPNLSLPIHSIANKNYLFSSAEVNTNEIETMLEKVLFVPLVDKQGRLVSVARREQPQEGFYVADQLIGPKSACFVIAEIGNNHNGDIELAKKLVDASVSAGANCAKFQMRHLKSLYQNAGNPDDIKENLGSQYTLDLLSRFQLSNEALFEVFDYCKAKNILPLCTPWDVTSLNTLEEYGMPAYKTASADLTNHDLLRAIAATGKPMICSTGMSTEEEIKESAALLRSLGASFVLLHCNSTYPAPFQDINLKYINRIESIENCLVGYSGHERGISVSMAAVALGAKVIERHITLDKSMEGNDHKASLLPREFKEMVSGIREIELALGEGESRKLSQGEMMNRVTLAKSLIINQDLKKGQTITRDMVEIKSPGKGLQPNKINELIGKSAKHDFKAGDFFYPSDVEVETTVRKNYDFPSAWGVPVRYHDFAEMTEGTNPDLVEFHFSYKDIELDHSTFFDAASPLDMDYVVHSPELFAGDHTLDLCTQDEAYRKHSISELQKVIDLTRALKPYFKKASTPLIITNVGGFTSERFYDQAERDTSYAILKDSLAQLDMDGVEIIPQTMPPFPWHFGGQQYHNLFVYPEEIVSFCQETGFRICFDTSHSKLACTHYNWSFHRFTELVSPFTAHIHYADSEGSGGEGLQIGEGEIDFPAIISVIKRLVPEASFIPEIWQGHENSGEGFWIGLEKLEEYYKS